MTKRRNVLTGKTATVSINRNGLAIEVGDIPAVNASLVAKCLLDVVRTLQRAGYDELLLDAGGLHGDLVSVADEEDGEDFAIPPESRRRVGFTA